MKLLKLVGVLILTTVFCTGCYNPGKNTPENLLNELPVYDSKNKELSDEISRLLGSSTLILPQNSTEVGKINKVDIDGDDKREVVFFQKKETLNEKVGFTVLDYYRGEENDYLYTELGTNIKYANFCDLDKDGKKEIIMLVENEDETTLTISKYFKGTINTVISKDNYAVLNDGGYKNLQVLIQDLNNDKKLDLISYAYNYKTKKMKISISNLVDDKLKILDEIEFEEVKNFESIEAVIGSISSDVKGVFLSYLNSERNDYTTQLVYLEDDSFVNAFEDYETKISNPYYIKFRDINNDGIINIPIINNVTSDTLNTNITKSSATVSWKKYNCKKGKDANLLFEIQIYYNYENNFKFLIPNNLTGKIYIAEQKNELGTQAKVFNFYYYSSQDEERSKLFTLTLVEKNIPTDTKTLNKSKHIFDTESYNFYLSNYDEKTLQKFDLNTNIIQDYFSKIQD